MEPDGLVQTGEVDAANDLEALRAEIKKLQNRLRGAAQAREQVRLQNVFVASLQSELQAAKERISALEKDRAPSPEGSAGHTTSGSPNLEQEHRELLEMYGGLEAEFEKEQKEYDELFEKFTAAEEEHQKEKQQWSEELSALKKAVAEATSTAPKGDTDLQLALDHKTFQLEKEKEVVCQLQETVDALRRDMEKFRENQYAREKTINDNYEDAMEGLYEERERMQLTIDRLQAIVNEKSGTAGGSSAEALTMAPLQDVEREKYMDVIRRLQLEILEARKMAFTIPYQYTWGSKLDDPAPQSHFVEEECAFIHREFLGEGATLHRGCVEVLDYTDPEKRAASVRAMFSAPTRKV